MHQMRWHSDQYSLQVDQVASWLLSFVVDPGCEWSGGTQFRRIACRVNFAPESKNPEGVSKLRIPDSKEHWKILNFWNPISVVRLSVLGLGASLTAATPLTTCCHCCNRSR
jgi:hypothetical protein